MPTTIDDAERSIVLSPELLGFLPYGTDGRSWLTTLRSRPILIRSLTKLDEMDPVDDIQRVAMGTTDYDLIPASELVVAPETGGHVLAAYDPDDPAVMIAAGFSWGGFFERRPRIVSDFLGVRQEARSLGIGEAMKRLQAAIAFQAGFEEIVWTVDPLRAANARLNFAKLGGTCHHYERNRYGEAFGEAHYGGLPSDRLHMTWSIRSERVIDRLLGKSEPASAVDGEARLIAIPGDIDRVLAADRDQALTWRLRVREEIETLFSAGWQIDGFAPADQDREHPALVLHRIF